ncbi:Vacuole [Heracleum sosnowskyi]|uniref:Vacuole n=1 Tax=Heracleum sosnowskyi TaxID=360622 RepID=A0AAD8JGB5_9APIA|nr:Vacuole [Heracleum sosnowskyi]
MSNTEEGESSSTSPSSGQTGPDVFLIVCRCFSVVTCLAAILCIVVNVISAVRSFKNGSNIFDGISRCCGVIIAVFVIVAETECRLLSKISKVLVYWPCRGMLQIFVAVMTRAYSQESGEGSDLLLLQNVASYVLLTCGVIYVILGLFCIGHLKRACQKKVKKQKKEVSANRATEDLQDLERQEELEAPLVADRVA